MLPFSPRVWGWSALSSDSGSLLCLFSPRVWGWSDYYVDFSSELKSFPHGCGDGPCDLYYPITGYKFSPRVWGWSGHPIITLTLENVFPTGVGMVRLNRAMAIMGGFPHGCGDGPPLVLEMSSIRMFSPRVWGWSARRPLALCSKRFSPRVWGWSVKPWDLTSRALVFPTGVGMVRRPYHREQTGACFPHGCGDGPRYLLPPPSMPMFSPRVWGWSGFGGPVGAKNVVFPTGVGMVRVFSCIS